MLATNQNNQLQVGAEGLSAEVCYSLGRKQDEIITLERFRDSMDDMAIFNKDPSIM